MEKTVNSKNNLQTSLSKFLTAEENGVSISGMLGNFGEVDFNRPWGGYIVLADAPTFKAKVLVINAKKRLSLQSHKNRTEIWIVVDGSVNATVGEETKTYQYGEIITIPKGAKHRLENPNDVVSKVAEIQIGTSFEESDIVRYEDDHGRVK